MIPINNNRLSKLTVKHDCKINTRSIDINKANVRKITDNTYSLAITELSDPRLLELELTPKAKIYIKTVLSPFASISYTLKKASIALDQTITGTITFLIFSLMNALTSSTFGAYEVKLPMLTICIVGSIWGVKKIVKSVKSIILSLPDGIYTCRKNIFNNNCSIFDFISGKDKTKKHLLIRKLKKLLKL